jgi:hypothetical protein
MESDAFSASKATIALKYANYSSPHRNLARHYQGLCLLIETKLNVVGRCHAPFDAAFQSNRHRGFTRFSDIAQ